MCWSFICSNFYFLFDKLTLRSENIKWRVFAFIILNKSKDVKTQSMKIQNKCVKSLIDIFII